MTDSEIYYPFYTNAKQPETFKEWLDYQLEFHKKFWEVAHEIIKINEQIMSHGFPLRRKESQALVFKAHSYRR